MDKDTLQVLAYIVENAPEGRSTVLTVGEIRSELKESAATEADVMRIVKELALNGLISLKYSDKSNVCVESVEKGILLVEKEERRGITAAIEDKSRSIKGVVMLSLISGFAGGAVAVALAIGIYFIIRALAL